MKYCHYLFVALGITSAAILASCQDEDFGYTADQIAYRTNFEKMYGSVKDIPTWDFSSYNLRKMGLAGGPSYSSITRAGGTRAGGNDGAKPTDKSLLLSSNSLSGISSDGMDGEWYKVEDPTLSWLNTKLPEGHYNVNLGNPFVLGVPQSDFAIIPIYQGHAGMNWDLHLVADGKDYTIWSKSEGIRYEEDYENGAEYHYGSGALHDWQGEDPNKYATKVWLGDAFPDALRSGASHIKLKIVIPEGATLTGKFTTSGENPIVWDFEGMGKGQTHSSNTYIYVLDDWKYFNDLNFVTGAGTNGCVLDGYNDARVRFYAIFEGKGSVMKELGTDVSNLTGHTVDRKNVQAKPIMIDHTKITKDFFLYLKIKSGDPSKSENYYANVGACQRSDEGMMVALPCTKPSNINNDYEYMIIGCEDADKNSDWDVNDIVFLLVGQGTLPRVKETVSKRYMIEDLGSTFDFDFNDIVVDVSGTIVKKYDGTIERYDNETATISHLCGTIPFQLKIGETVLPYVSDPTNEETTKSELSSAHPSDFDTRGVNWNPNKTITVSGWNPNTNNIFVKVWPQRKTSEGAGPSDNPNDNFSDFSSVPTSGQFGDMNFGFPSNGDFPYIIAVDPSVEWMPELKSVPESWFKTWPKQYYDYNSTTPSDPVNPSPAPTTLFDGTKDLGTWENSDENHTLVIAKAQFAGCNIGDKITITISDRSGSDHKIKIAKNVDGWPNAISSTPEYGFDFASVDTKEIAIDQTFLDAVSSNDIVIYGCGVTVSKVTLVKQ